jgi:hypothetical protein
MSDHKQFDQKEKKSYILNIDRSEAIKGNFSSEAFLNVNEVPMVKSLEQRIILSL